MASASGTSLVSDCLRSRNASACTNLFTTLSVPCPRLLLSKEAADLCNPFSDSVTKRKLQNASLPVERLLTQQFRKVRRNQGLINSATFSVAAYLRLRSKSRWLVREGAQQVASFRGIGKRKRGASLPKGVQYF